MRPPLQSYDTPREFTIRRCFALFAPDSADIGEDTPPLLSDPHDHGTEWPGASVAAGPSTVVMRAITTDFDFRFLPLRVPAAGFAFVPKKTESPVPLFRPSTDAQSRVLYAHHRTTNG
jgi:hypothetical protein